MAVEKLNGKKFIIVEHKEDPNMYGIALTEDKYKGIIYQYGKVDLDENSIRRADGLADIKFEYNVLNNSTDIDIDNDAELQQLMGEILVEMIKDVVENNGEYRGSDSEGSENG